MPVREPRKAERNAEMPSTLTAITYRQKASDASISRRVSIFERERTPVREPRKAERNAEMP
ncbi:MAG: hypothetical protein IJB97_01495, partial [Clostridia bacterium]|nr:hypothetical protein [Clostridia bacterium]